MPQGSHSERTDVTLRLRSTAAGWALSSSCPKGRVGEGTYRNFMHLKSPPWGVFFIMIMRKG